MYNIPKNESSFKWCIDETERDLFSLNFDRNLRLNDGCLDFINWSRLGATLAICSALIQKKDANLIIINKHITKFQIYRDLFGTAPVILFCDDDAFILVATQ